MLGFTSRPKIQKVKLQSRAKKLKQVKTEIKQEVQKRRKLDAAKQSGKSFDMRGFFGGENEHKEGMLNAVEDIWGMLCTCDYVLSGKLLPREGRFFKVFSSL